MSVLADILIPPLDRPYTYLVGKNLQADLKPGFKVSIPIGKRFTSGYVVGLREDNPDTVRTFELKEIADIVGRSPSFRIEDLEFYQRIAEYYGDHLSNVLDVAIPALSPPKFDAVVSLTGVPLPEKAGERQKEIITLLHATPEPMARSLLLRRLRGAAKSLDTLKEQGIVQFTEIEVRSDLSPRAPHAAWTKKDIELTLHQKTAVSRINKVVDEGVFAPFLLHGVTGSGKTEVYLDVVSHAIAQGKGALVLVPEIALTPQLIDRFQARFQSAIAVLHSALVKRFRWDSWRSLVEGRCRIAIGARSAVFAPMENLGVIIVDEEHDQSYKQAEGLRYHGRDIAVLRAKHRSCPVVLGSATPSLESYHHAATKKYTYISIPARPNAAPPLSFQVVDLNRLRNNEMPSPNVSAPLCDELTSTFAAGDQAFVLYNRRGFASYLQCDTCRHVISCPNCSVTLTYHKKKHSLVCHYCNLTAVPATFCPACREKKKPAPDAEQKTPGKLVHRGGGTEKAYEELTQLFPQVAIDRLDRDTVSDFDSYKDVLDRVRNKQTQLLVGTQMIAKGHDVPEVTLVGILDCDIGLQIPDFRSAERAFQLLTQAAGRAGRHEKAGRVVLQTRLPTHPAIKKTVEADFRGFAAGELALRKALSYPPFCRLLRIIVSSNDQKLPERILQAFKEMVDTVSPQLPAPLTVLGPAPAPIEKIKTMWRWHMLLKCERSSILHHVLMMLKGQAKKNKQARVVFDVDPQDML